MELFNYGSEAIKRVLPGSVILKSKLNPESLKPTFSFFYFFLRVKQRCDWRLPQSLRPSTSGEPISGSVGPSAL